MAEVMKHCHTFTDGDVPVTMHQSPHGWFTVTYGKQMRAELTYEETAVEYGECVMHSLTCAAILDTN